MLLALLPAPPGSKSYLHLIFLQTSYSKGGYISENIFILVISSKNTRSVCQIRKVDGFYVFFEYVMKMKIPSLIITTLPLDTYQFVYFGQSLDGDNFKIVIFVSTMNLL